MSNNDTRALLERACAKAIDTMLTGDDVATVRQATGHHVVIIRTVESDEREARTAQRREEHAERVRETGAAELNAASDALASAAAEVDALRAELARQTGIAVDLHERLDAAEQMVVECCALLADVKNAEWMSRREGLTPSPFWGDEWQSRIDAALSRTEAVAGRWFSKEDLSRTVAMAEGIIQQAADHFRAERDAAIAARDEAVAGLDVYEQRIREIADDVFGLQDASGASVVLLDAIGRQCHRERIERTSAERARDEVGIQLAAAQARIKLLEEGATLLRHIDEFKGEQKWGANGANHYHVPCDVIDIGVGCFLSALDAVPGDALAPRITAALEASGIDTSNVKGLE